MIKLDGISKRFTTGDIVTAALDGIDLEIGRGEFVAITGPSGCGKSTLLGVLGLLDGADGGKYLFDGDDLVGLAERGRNAVRRGKIGFIFQNFNLIEEMSVAENVELALQYSEQDGGQRKQRVQQMLEKLGVAHRARHRPSQLSGGQQQRVAIARALVCRPSVLLADEPTGNLDSAHGEEVMRLLAEIHREGTTVVMVTHSPAHAAHAQRVVQLLDGRIQQEFKQ